VEDLCTEDRDGLSRENSYACESRRKGSLQWNSLNCCTKVRIESEDSGELLTWLAGGEHVRVILAACQDGLQLLRDIRIRILRVNVPASSRFPSFLAIPTQPWSQTPSGW